MNPSIETKIKEDRWVIVGKKEHINVEFLPDDIYPLISGMGENHPLLPKHITLIETVDKSGTKRIFAEAYTKDTGFESQEIPTGKHIEDIHKEIEDNTNSVYRNMLI